MAAQSTPSPVLLGASSRRTSCVSDCGSSECSSAPSARHSPTMPMGTPPRLSPQASLSGPHTSTAPGPLSAVLSDALRRRASCLSDSSNSENSSVPSGGGRSFVMPRPAPLAPPRRIAIRGPPSSPSPAPPSAGPTSPATPLSPQNPGPKPAAPRPLCLDFLNGKCRHQRSRCRYYHPQPEELALTVPCPAPDPAGAGPTNGPSDHICEVWALTGFCKYGPRCWKQHPQLTAESESPIDKPITHKFQQWLKSRLLDPSSPALRSWDSSAHGSLSRRSSLASLGTPQSPLLDGVARSSTSDVLSCALDRLRSHSIDMPSSGSPVPGVQQVPSAVDCLPPSVAPPCVTMAVPFVHQPYTP